jgi:hypothetical protein
MNSIASTEMTATACIRRKLRSDARRSGQEQALDGVTGSGWPGRNGERVHDMDWHRLFQRFVGWRSARGVVFGAARPFSVKFRENQFLGKKHVLERPTESRCRNDLPSQIPYATEQGCDSADQRTPNALTGSLQGLPDRGKLPDGNLVSATASGVFLVVILQYPAEE